MVCASHFMYRVFENRILESKRLLIQNTKQLAFPRVALFLTKPPTRWILSAFSTQHSSQSAVFNQLTDRGVLSLRIC